MSEFLPARVDGENERYDASFVGRGFHWPMVVDHTGSIRLTDTTDDVSRSMHIILMTAPGERVMRPTFGCRIWDLVFEPITPSLFGLIAQAVYEALGQWEPRVYVDEVTPYGDEDDSSLVRILIRYRLRSSNDPRNLVFPFYVIPHEPE